MTTTTKIFWIIGKARTFSQFTFNAFQTQCVVTPHSMPSCHIILEGLLKGLHPIRYTK